MSESSNHSNSDSSSTSNGLSGAVPEQHPSEAMDDVLERSSVTSYEEDNDGFRIYDNNHHHHCLLQVLGMSQDYEIPPPSPPLTNDLLPDSLSDSSFLVEIVVTCHSHAPLQPNSLGIAYNYSYWRIRYNSNHNHQVIVPLPLTWPAVPTTLIWIRNPSLLFMIKGISNI
jgi:hypothetical protein